MEANFNSSRRGDERILLTADSMRRIGLQSKDTTVFVQGVPRKCIMRDLSFKGAKVILVGIAKFLVGRECILRLEFEDSDEPLDIKGKVVRYEEVEGRKDLTAAAIQFDEALVPMKYKMHVNDIHRLTRGRQARGGRPGREGYWR